MGREVRRVPLDFEWEIGKLWWGFLMPETLSEDTCDACGGHGYSPEGHHLREQWYGNASFHPGDTGSTPFTVDTPTIRRRAEWNVQQSPQFYGNDEDAVVREAGRLAHLFNTSWSHHLAQEDVDALIEAERLRDFTHRRNNETCRWEPIEPAPIITAEQVNLWSTDFGIGHDSTNAWICVRAKAERLGFSELCSTCKGHGSAEKHAGQRQAAEAWEPTDPPKGDGWQLWNTTTEGHPMTPVFATAEELARHCAHTRVSWFGHDPAPYEQWLESFGGKGIMGAVTLAPGVVVM